MQDQRSGRRATRLLRWTERLLIIAGGAVLVWCGLLVSDAIIAQRQARIALEAAVPVEAPRWPSALEEPAEAPPPAAAVYSRSPIATLSIPRIQLSAAVLHGSDAQTLRHGPGHLEHSALPGDRGNVVIAGHRDTFFWPLRNIRLGDDILLETPEERFHYQVTSLRVVNPREVGVLAPTDEATLTLITCYPFRMIGNAPDRFIVRAIRVGKAVAPAIEARTLPPVDWIHAPVLEQTAVSASGSVTSGTRDSDETLVRQAVEHVRFVLDTRFETCDVDVTGNRATASCAEAAGPPSGADTHLRTFMLERAAGGWAIRSIERR